MIISKFLIVLGFFIITESIIFDKEINSLDSKALCLNGSQSFLYVSPNSSTSGIIVYFMPTPTPIFCGGNSLSASLDNCISVHTQVSSFWPNQLSITSGILSDPAYASWGKVIIPSCDGSLFQGYASQATKYKGKDFYFRGNRIIKSHLQLISSKRFNMSSFDRIVFAGSGYGAIGALIWSRYFYDNIILSQKHVAKFSLILDSLPTSYLSFKSGKNEYQVALANLAKLVNQEELNPFILCTLQNEGEQWRCFGIKQSYYYLNFPLMIVDSQYDTITIKQILEIDCINKTSGSLKGCSEKERSYLEKYRSQKIIFLYEFANFHDNSVWSVSCASETLLNSQKYADVNWNVGGLLSQNVQQFVASSRATSLNHLPWPSNSKCSGTA